MDAAWLGELLSGQANVPLHPRGLTLRGARLTGQLNWRQLPLRTAVALRECVFDTEAPAVFDQATGIQLELTGCRLAGLSARQLHLTHDLALDKSFVLGTVTVVDAEIGGSLTADGASFGAPAEAASPGQLAVNGDQLHVGAHLRLSGGFRAHGQVALTGARINGRLVCTGAMLTSDTDAVMAERVQVGGEVMLDGCSATGDVRLSGAIIGRQLNCLGGSFTNPSGNALTCDGTVITGDVLFIEGFAAVGNVVLMGTKIGGQLNCLGGKFTNPGGNALSCDSADITGAVFLGNRFTAVGAVVLTGAKIGGQLSCSGGKFTNPGGNALTCDYADIGGTVFLRNGFTASGQVRMPGAKIGGGLNCSGSEFINPGENALSCNGAQITGDVLLTKMLSPSGEAMFKAGGEITLSGAKIGGRLDCSRGEFTNPGGNALTCDGTDITSDVLLTEGFAASGQVVLIGATIGGQLNCSGGKFTNPGGNALDGTTITVQHSFIWAGLAAAPEGTVDLTNAHVGQLKDDQASWPTEGKLRIVGFSYDRLSDEAENDPQERLRWIHLQPGYSPQPYRQLADVYRNAGKESCARAILIAKQQDLRTRGKLPWYSSIWNAFIGATIGHGYRTLRAALLLPALYVISVLLIGYAGRHSDMLAVHATPGHIVSSATCTSRYPCLSVLAYPIDYVIPILNLHQAEYWQPDAHTLWGHVARDWLFLATALGWVATTLLVAAITGLARND